MQEPDQQKFAWYVIVVLLLAYTFSFIDRMILNLLVEPIKSDLQLSDTRISLLQGFSFAVFYALAGLPIGRLVDVFNRRNIIAAGITLWSLMTVFCGLSWQYWQLFLARVGVGIGEATLIPAAYSLISDYFPRKYLGLALGLFSMGASIGAGLALLIGGVSVDFFMEIGPRRIPFIGVLQPWQLTFLFVGLPGLIVAGLMFTLQEPPRKDMLVSGSQPRKSLPLGQVFAYLGKNSKTISLHHLATGLGAFGSYSIFAWTPVVLVRVNDWSPSHTGYAMGAVILVIGSIGVASGGWFSDYVTGRGRSTGRLMICALGHLVAALAAIFLPFQEDVFYFVFVFSIVIFAAFMTIGPSAAALQEIMPNQMRGQASAIYFFVINIIGIGLGPTVVALITDYVFRDPLAVHYSLAIVTTSAYVLSAMLYYLAREPYKESFKTARLRQSRASS